jgi:hypothetical protein
VSLIDDDAGPVLKAADGCLDAGDLFLLGCVHLLLAQQAQLFFHGVR